MKGDFSRHTFDPTKHFSSVLMQEGRVTLDADYNEQSAILLHYMRTLARDLIGPYAAPVENAGFFLYPHDEEGFTISAGRYYVDGILVENESECTYAIQPDYRVAPDDPLLNESKAKKDQAFWVYLDVWERHITSLEDDSIREKALGGPDTCTRSKVVWQVKVREIDLLEEDSTKEIAELEAKRQKLELALKKDPGIDEEKKKEILGQIDMITKQIASLKSETGPSCETQLADLITLSRVKLAARVDPGQKNDDPCVTPPDSKYRGAENQLYRVEIHEGGPEGDATFKWSRDNGSNATAWLGTSGNDIHVASTRGFTEGGWLELTDEDLDLAGKPGPLVKIVKVENGVLLVDPDPGTEDALNWSERRLHPKVRHWNQAQRGDIKLTDGAIPLKETVSKAEGWIDLEDGIQVRFEASGEYHSGDYWLIPARVATGNLEWPTEGKEVAAAVKPMGIEHHYAPLGFMAWKDKAWHFKSCRCHFEPLSSCFAKGSVAVGEHLIKTSGPIMPLMAAKQPKRVKAGRKKPAP
jgi:hypothetical protein